jgi:hypothetical protein
MKMRINKDQELVIAGYVRSFMRLKDDISSDAHPKCMFRQFV